MSESTYFPHFVVERQYFGDDERDTRIAPVPKLFDNPWAL
jgi:hypothetical protein